MTKWNKDDILCLEDERREENKMPVTNEKDLVERQIQDVKEMILLLLDMDDLEKREFKGIMAGYKLAKQTPA